MTTFFKCFSCHQSNEDIQPDPTSVINMPNREVMGDKISPTKNEEITNPLALTSIQTSNKNSTELNKKVSLTHMNDFNDIAKDFNAIKIELKNNIHILSTDDNYSSAEYIEHNFNGKNIDFPALVNICKQIINHTKQQKTQLNEQLLTMKTKAIENEAKLLAQDKKYQQLQVINNKNREENADLLMKYKCSDDELQKVKRLLIVSEIKFKKQLKDITVENDFKVEEITNEYNLKWEKAKEDQCKRDDNLEEILKTNKTYLLKIKQTMKDLQTRNDDLTINAKKWHTLWLEQRQNIKKEMRKYKSKHLDANVNHTKQ